MEYNGYSVVFPEGKTPFPSQISMMETMLDACDASEHALIESPTGTGKTLALLSAALTWQRKNQDTKTKIYYVSRTHPQLKQAVDELKRSGLTWDGFKMAVLGSREQYCVNPCARAGTKDCSQLVQDSECEWYVNFGVLAHQTAEKIQDIEDLIADGKAMGGCPYYASRMRAGAADLVFLPYNYLLDIGIFSRMSIDLEGSIIIFDEAHNIEDVARSAASFEMNQDMLRGYMETLLYCSDDDLDQMIQKIVDLLKRISEWIDERPYATEDNHLENGIVPSARTIEWATREEIYELRSCVSAINACKSTNEMNGALSFMEQLLYRIDYMLDEPGDFRLAVQPPKGGEEEDEEDDDEEGREKKPRILVNKSLHIWCLRPAAVFSRLFKGVRSVILTSGTLSPMDAFAYELGIEFTHMLEAPHVCDVSTRLSAMAFVHHGDELLDATYQNVQRVDYLDVVGNALVRISEVTPNGMLVFFPSYAMMNRCLSRWGSLSFGGKRVFAETQVSVAAFEPVIRQYRDACVRHPRGAILFAVFRGKISEGIDFKDEAARCVAIVGIPYPHARDMLILQKKAHQNRRRQEEEDVLSGGDWYNLQAYRALNQGIGRIIRHIGDYGALIFLDHRFTKRSSVERLSKWMRSCVTGYSKVEDGLEELDDFFKRLR